ncbi:MAG TPA: inositol monophosphatase family protein [Methylomirabilota bacterium]|nr:inositol monophosphatase family protein [Methylomirabilota bacterium]
MSEAALAAAVEAARAAGRVALKYYHGGFEITLKADATPVTQADREAERTIVEILKKAFPEHGFLGEEFGSSGAADTRWIIDPIDGTKNFVRRIPIWATLIGLEERGEITVGVIHNPVTGELYTARKGGGAFLNGERIRISDETDMREAYLMHAGLRAARTTRYWDGFMRLVDATDRQRGFGDYIGYGLIAEGKADIYVEIYPETSGLKPWDLAPCKIIVEEAGGRFTDLEGRPTIYTGSALATNGRLHDAALALLRP